MNTTNEPLTEDKIRYAEDYYKQNIGRVFEFNDIASAVQGLKKELCNKYKCKGDCWKCIAVDEWFPALVKK